MSHHEGGLVAKGPPQHNAETGLAMPRFSLILCLLAVVLLDLLFVSNTPDDAYITFRYSKHLAEGYGFGAWNTSGPPVEGYTSPLWMLLLAGASALGIGLPLASKTIGILSHLALVAAFLGWPSRIARHEDPVLEPIRSKRVMQTAGLLLALNLPMSWYATSGMETTLFAALFGITLAGVFLSAPPFIVASSTVLLVAARPEGVVGALLCAWIAQNLAPKDGNRPPLVRPILGAIIIAVIGLIAYRLAVFGELLPNTYWAKSGGAGVRHILLGLRHTFEWFANNPLTLFLIGLAAAPLFGRRFGAEVRRQQPIALACFVFFLLYLLYIIKAGGDTTPFPFGRHLVHIGALLALLSAIAIVEWSEARPTSRFAILALAVVLPAISTMWSHDGQMRDAIAATLRSRSRETDTARNRYLDRFREIVKPSTTVATSIAGAIPFEVEAKYIDVLGLNTRHIAKFGTFDPHGPQDSKTDMKWVIAQRPDVIEAYFPATLLLGSDPQALRRYVDGDLLSKMHRELLTDTEFATSYLFIRNWPYDVLDRALFIRESYFDSLSLEIQLKLDCVPIGKTQAGTFQKQ